MKRGVLLTLALTVLVLAAGCAHRGKGTVAKLDTTRRLTVLYIWDADGHTDMALLKGLKAEAASYLKSHGFTVSTDPDATEGYLKITVDEAGADGAYIRGRAYIVDSYDQSVRYDKTYEVTGGEGYPTAAFVEGALADYAGASRAPVRARDSGY